MEAVYNEILV